MDVVHEVGSAVSVRAGEVEPFRYVYAASDPQVESPRPYFHPIRSLDGDVVSVYRPWDHVWHKGLALSLPHLGPDNFWGGPTFVRGKDYVWLDNNGAMRSVGDASVERGKTGVTLRHALDWTTQQDVHVIAEDRRVVVDLLGPTAWVLVLETSLVNVSGAPLDIGSPTTEGRPNAGYGGLFWRGPRSFEGGRVEAAGALLGETAVMGARAPWAAFIGQHDESTRWSTIMFVDDPTNLRHPTQWFARSTPYGCLGPAPFFDTTHHVADGDRLALRYAFIVATGKATTADLEHLAAQGATTLSATTT
ncbi:MAG: PmoA family protein [Saccharothrix sp.]|nr:PmoA family protein [Saccharothrix sp.]